MRVEVELGFQQIDVRADEVDALHNGGFQRLFAHLRKAEGGALHNPVFREGRCDGVHPVAHRLGGGAAGPDVVFDAEISVGTAGVMTRGQDDAAPGTEPPDFR